MGALTSRQNADVQEADVGTNHAYKYPPKSGNYFGTHFIMGGERFDTPQPEAYLFGENADLNFLGSRPTAFPYPPPQAHEPTKTLKSLVNIRKESVRFSKAIDCSSTTPTTKIHAGSGDLVSNNIGSGGVVVGSGGGVENKINSFNIEFVYDSDAKCAVTIYYFCTEETTSTGISYIPRDPSLTSETYQCKRGVNQLFAQSSHVFNPNLFSDEDLSYNPERNIFPVAIHCVVDHGTPEETKQSHTTICVIDHHTDGTYVLRALKQKIFVDGLCYLLQEIYGIENKNINKASIDDDTDDNGSECVICMSDIRDTLILPCRHLCLCNSCADSLRYQANNCPICRAPFRALLQIKAVQKQLPTNATNLSSSQGSQDGDNIPSGYTAVSLIEALNGPAQVTIRQTLSNDVTDNIDNNDAMQAAENLNRSLQNQVVNSTSDQDQQLKEKCQLNPPEIRMSVLLTKDEELSAGSNIVGSDHHNHSSITSKGKGLKHKGQINKLSDNVMIVNEKNKVNFQRQDLDDDSDAEKLSPLLENITNKIIQNSALHMDGVDESIDDTDSDPDDLVKKSTTSMLVQQSDTSNNTGIGGIGSCISSGISGAADDSDYYTPEDPHTTILSPLCPDKKTGIVRDELTNQQITSIAGDSTTNDGVNINNIPAVQAVKENSLPDSPISGNSAVSTRSSGDSYSSSSSTRQLLSSTTTTTAAAAAAAVTVVGPSSSVHGVPSSSNDSSHEKSHSLSV